MFQYDKENNLLKELPTMERPNANDYINGSPCGSDYDEIDNEMEIYEKHLASLRTITCHESCKTLWEHEQKIGEKEFTIGRGEPLQIVMTDLQGWLKMPTEEQDEYFEKVAIPITTKETAENECPSYEEAGGNKSWNEMTDLERANYNLIKAHNVIAVQKNTIKRLREQQSLPGTEERKFSEKDISDAYAQGYNDNAAGRKTMEFHLKAFLLKKSTNPPK
jgi:hypothetical protein